jgi:hypothetical protein
LLPRRRLWYARGDRGPSGSVWGDGGAGAIPRRFFWLYL